MDTEIYYFSGTGNSLHVAKELEKRIPNCSLIPIVSILQNDEKIITKSEIIGIIFPIHGLAIPWPVKKFFQKINLKSASYIFAISTRECFSTIFSKIDKILAKQNKSLNSFLSIEMPQTYIPLFKLYSQDRFNKVESKMLKELDLFQEIIIERKISKKKNSKLWFLLSHMIYPIITAYYQKKRFPKMEKSFFFNSDCNACGICEKVCLSNKIILQNKKPIWQENITCMYCFACLHFCPMKAIQIKGRKTEKKGRYHHPEITVKDIINQKIKNG
ncbi:MAG: EFR1 family ferrodoxin [Candidatus Lokiarchaeota archaeon]|nr:EFR1 family ferrodoxin [Candidatus Lokiarchaeota archaeon]